MAMSTKYHGQVEGNDGSSFTPTALEVEAALRHDRRMKMRELKADRKWQRNELTDLDPEHIDVFLVEDKPSVVGESSFVKTSTSKKELSREQEKDEEPFAVRRRRSRKPKQRDENVLGSDNTAGPSTTMMLKAQWNTTASSPYSELDTKGPFKLPVASCTPVHRYGGRRAAVCDALGDQETTTARIRRRVMHKRCPDILDWLLD